MALFLLYSVHASPRGRWPLRSDTAIQRYTLYSYTTLYTYNLCNTPLVLLAGPAPYGPPVARQATHPDGHPEAALPYKHKGRELFDEREPALQMLAVAPVYSPCHCRLPLPLPLAFGLLALIHSGTEPLFSTAIGPAGHECFSTHLC